MTTTNTDPLTEATTYRVERTRIEVRCMKRVGRAKARYEAEEQAATTAEAEEIEALDAALSPGARAVLDAAKAGG